MPFLDCGPKIEGGGNRVCLFGKDGRDIGGTTFGETAFDETVFDKTT